MNIKLDKYNMASIQYGNIDKKYYEDIEDITTCILKYKPVKNPFKIYAKYLKEHDNYDINIELEYDGYPAYREKPETTVLGIRCYSRI